MKLITALSILSLAGVAAAQESCTALATLVPSCAVRLYRFSFPLLSLLTLRRRAVLVQRLRSLVVPTETSPVK
jgi:hypothetical protein